MLSIFPFKIDFLTPLSSFLVINICLVSFLNEAGNSKPRCVTLYRTFLYFFKMFIILLSSISICTGFKPSTTSKFCCTLIMIVSTDYDMFSFPFLPSLVIEKLCIFLAFILGLSPFMGASWNSKPFFIALLSM